MYEKLTKCPIFTHCPKMPKLYMIIAGKIYFLLGERRAHLHPAPVYYTYGREGINLSHGCLKTLAALPPSTLLPLPTILPSSPTVPFFPHHSLLS